MGLKAFLHGRGKRCDPGSAQSERGAWVDGIDFHLHYKKTQKHP
jgi:hypothetical protein